MWVCAGSLYLLYMYVQHIYNLHIYLLLNLALHACLQVPSTPSMGGSRQDIGGGHQLLPGLPGNNTWSPAPSPVPSSLHPNLVGGQSPALVLGASTPASNPGAYLSSPHTVVASHAPPPLMGNSRTNQQAVQHNTAVTNR